MADTIPMYNLKAVMHEVSLSAATLRAWELRYGLPKPHRTAGGQRLYSKQDIELLKWLVARQNEGLSISHAVEMWKAQKTGEQASASAAGVQVLEQGTGEAMFDELRQRWIAACLAFDDLAANRILDHAFALAAPETICTELLQKGLSQVGQLWYSGYLRVQQEHFASAIAVRRLNSLLAVTVPPSRSSRLIAACPPGEAHDFILLLVTYLLRRAGWDVVFLGSDVPLQHLDFTIQTTSPSLVLSAAQTLTTAASLRLMSEVLVQQGIPLAYGGGFFTTLPTNIRYISGYYLGSDILQVAQIVDRLVNVPSPMPTALPVSSEYLSTLHSFHQQKAMIQSYVTSELRTAQIETSLLESAVENFSHMVSSALTLGDINLLDQTIVWLNGLLENFAFPPSLLTQLYLKYRQAVLSNLGEDAGVILSWLDKQLSVGNPDGKSISTSSR